MIDAVYDALPNGRSGLAPQEKLEELYERWDELDVVQAIYNLIYNEIEDRIIGRIAGGAADALRDQFGRDITTIQN